MTGEQIERFTDYFVTLWPPARAWEDSQWAYWGEVLRDHGPTWVNRAVEQLIRQPVDGGFPPGLAAMIVALGQVEHELRMKITYGEQDLARAEAEGDDDRVDRIRVALARWHERLAQ